MHLEKQNGELRTGAWRLINRKVEEKGQTLVLSVDEMSVKVLQKEGFRPFLNFTRVLFRNLEKGRVDLGPSDEDQEGPKSCGARKCGFSFDPGALGTWIPDQRIAGFCTDDLVAAEVTYVSEGTQRQLVVCSAYLPYDKKESPPTRELRDLVAWCEKEKKQLIVGCDANSHHTVWGSSDVNDRGESLLDFLFSYNLEILNVGNEPTFVIKNRSEVIDITVGSGPICNNIARWHVSNEPSMSDHRHIHFEIITDYNPQVRTYRDPKRTDWDSYRTELQARTREICTKLRNTYDLERAVEELQNAVTRSYEYSCPIKVRSDKHTVPWWSKELTQLRGQTRKLFNRAKRTGEWEAYRATLTEYNKEIRKAKRDSWRKFCEDIDSVPQCAKLQRLLSKNGHTKLGSLKAPSGEYTKTGRETLELLLNTHFPGSRLLNHGDEYDWNHQQRVTTGSRQNWEVAKMV
ncbi:uncharacterized protein LOC111692666, partial [Anoplophora glabripennis]|uniref:uncharacterized protein LOC111692666 n=1 Tax=Anoplophora glabripennis TaxID=217634 RepID=UPI000C789B55